MEWRTTTRLALWGMVLGAALLLVAPAHGGRERWRKVYVPETSWCSGPNHIFLFQDASGARKAAPRGWCTIGPESLMRGSRFVCVLRDGSMEWEGPEAVDGDGTCYGRRIF